MFTNFDITPCFLFTVLLASNMVQPSKTQACQPSVCQYGGFCFSNRCVCPLGLTGPTCTNVDCDNYPCLNGGTCIRGSLPNQDTCQCPDGFVLPYCTTSCTFCFNGGTCRSGFCSCDSGFVGPTCQNSIFAYVNPVAITVREGNNDHDVTVQVCRQPTNSQITFSVLTLPGSAANGSDFKETPFSQNVIIPVSEVCTPVTVTIKTDQMFELTEEFNLFLVTQDPVIPEVYTLTNNVITTITVTNDDPINCDLDRPCFNGGTCRPSALQDPCTCPGGFVEPFCTTSCLIVPCQNGGICSDDVCFCQPGFTGPTCQSAIAAYLSPKEITVTEGHVGQKAVTVQVCRQPSSEEVTLAVYTNASSASDSALPDVDFVNIPISPRQDVTISAGQTCTPVNVSIISDLTQEMTSKVFYLFLTDPQPPSSSMVHIVSGHSFTVITITDDDPDCFKLYTAGQCSPNQCSCTKGTCTSQTGRCEATCSVYQCPANIVSESLSQVNPPSSVEIRCILEGSTAVVNRLQIRLSRSEQMIDEHGITQDTNPDISANRREETYRVTSVSEDDQFFCVLSLGPSIVGSINVTGFVYKLPSIRDPPTQLTRTTTSVTITWRPWDEETDVGDPPVVAYIPYYKMDLSQDWMSGSRIQADQTLQYTASSLESDRNYTFSVAAVREGEGGEGPRGPPVTIKTLCIDVVPQMVTTTLTATNDVTVTWQQPTMRCSTGITQFTIYYEKENDVSSRQEAGRADPNAESFTVDGSLLEPGTTYSIAVTVTTDQESALSEGSFLTTSEPPSSPPVYLVALVIPFLLIVILLVVILKRHSNRIWRKPASESKPVDVQDVDYVNAGVTDDPEDYIALEEQSRNNPAPKYQDLTEKETTTQVSGYERTILETADAAPKAMPHQGIKRQTNYQYEDVNLGETDARKLPSVPQPDLQSEDDTEYEVPEMFEEYTGVYINTLGVSKPITPTPMKITEYKTFMGRERSKVISEIVQQYTALETGQQHPWTAAVKLQNKPKNFFKILLPYDHSRVRLDTDGSDVRSDYINASYIKNHQGKVSFIAAQGPMEGTKDDFWRMVWKEDVETIVTLVDKDGTEQHSKDAQYWPNEVNRSQKYGAITVFLMETTVFRSYILREMNVIKGNEKVLTSVRQYEIPCWKYGGVPSEPADLISVIKQIKNHQNGGKHLLVHCSNGVGATGVFISLYDLMDVIKTKKEVSVFDVIEGMRKDRVNMVLTKLQYLFICDALLEAMLSPDSQMSCDQLKKLDLSAMKKKCKKEFQILQETTKHQEDLATLAGNSSENNHKNRFPDLLPVDKFRPVLKSPGKLFGSNDYINATFAKDITQRGFIMTQSPLATTVEDVWRLVFDYDCTSIVMLNTVDDSDESLTVYWPNVHNAATSNGLMTVICKKIEESDVFTRRQFEVKHKRSQKSLLVDQFSFHGWHGNKPDVHKLREFIKYTRTKGTGPALVHCINGVGLSAVYVTVISELERIEKEGAVDVFQTLNKLRKQCPKAVQTQDEYLLCYELLRDHLNNPEEYAVVF